MHEAFEIQDQRIREMHRYDRNSKYSTAKKVLMANKNINIANSQFNEYLKQESRGYISQKSLKFCLEMF